MRAWNAIRHGDYPSTCNDCRFLNGQIVENDQPFHLEDGTPVYDVPMHSNCQCTITPVNEDTYRVYQETQRSLSPVTHLAQGLKHANHQ